jgi:diadenosine tetraphosphatase ApaH/serine/threonine PP2A family protein phosphatase
MPGRRRPDDGHLLLRTPLPAVAAERISFEDFTLAHGSRASRCGAITDTRRPMATDSFSTNYCLIGHSHLPLIFHRPLGDSQAAFVAVSWQEPLELDPRMILNPGSVGQPRDMDPRAAYAILDIHAGTWHAHRVAYDTNAVGDRMMAAGLPERQAMRLLAGW